MSYSISYRPIVFPLLVILVLALSWQLSQAEEDVSEPEPDMLAGTAWSPPGSELTTTANLNGNFPEVSYSPTDGEVIVVFNGWSTGSASSRNPYYVRSTNDGGSWSAPTTIDSDTTLATVTVAHDSSGNAHAAWIATNQATTYTIYYSKKNTGTTTWSSRATISSVTMTSNFPPAINNLTIIASGANTVDIIWEGLINTSNPDPTLWHSRSTNGGSSWSAAARVNTATDRKATSPAVTADASGNLHLVWEQQTSILADSNIYYANYNGATWSTALDMTTHVEVQNDAYRPDIEFTDSQVYIAFSEGRDASNSDQQTVYSIHCQTGQTCASASHWSGLANISSQALDVNASDPFYIIPSLAYSSGQNSLFVFFHGIVNGDSSGNELLRQNSTCTNWASAQSITTSSQRSIRPNVDIEGSTVHLTYESADSDQIYYMKDTFECVVGLISYLPLVTR